MKQVYWMNDCAVTPLAFSSEDNYSRIKTGHSSIINQPQLSLNDKPFWASLFSESQKSQLADLLGGIINTKHYTLFEQLCIYSIHQAITQSNIDFTHAKNLFILSTTKGNIELIDIPGDERLKLHTTAERITTAIGLNAFPLVISNACISGVSAIITAKRLLAEGNYDHAIVCGADVITSFVAKGFQSLNATADELCKPYDASRNGINLGEAAATVILSNQRTSSIMVKGGSVSNDANHISGPSRTGAELANTVNIALKESEIDKSQLAFISAHGTATIFNDEMESKAFELAGLSDILLQSLKPHFGHALGAAGILESIISIQALRDEIVLPSLQYKEYGVSGKINIASSLLHSSQKNILKTASGFGGCNASIVYSKL